MTALAGVRGAVTLAGIMTLPLALRDGSAFPTRDLAIFLAAGVIVLTLLAANFALPYFLKGVELHEEDGQNQQEADEARLAAAQAAIAAMERILRDPQKEGPDAELYGQAGARIAAQYRQQIQAHLNRNEPRQQVWRCRGQSEANLRNAEQSSCGSFQ